MMGHKISTYHDIEMKGIEFLRNIYASSGLSIKPKTQANKLEMIKTIITSLGLNPDEILTKEALIKPHRTIQNQTTREESYIQILSNKLKESLIEQIKPKNSILERPEEYSP